MESPVLFQTTVRDGNRAPLQQRQNPRLHLWLRPVGYETSERGLNAEHDGRNKECRLRGRRSSTTLPGSAMTHRRQMQDYAPEGKTTRLHPWVELTGMDVMDVCKHFKDPGQIAL